ncbi:hypothetical protein, partial [Methylibium sp. T29]|uniref:hypothetical protein n=1 Tax=Methylibium sp. T29 TaxID=1430884 RepID=UPI0020A674E4
MREIATLRRRVAPQCAGHPAEVLCAHQGQQGRIGHGQRAFGGGRGMGPVGLESELQPRACSA